MLTIQNTEAIRRIEEAIGYTFRDKRLLIQVLTRKTYLKIDPEAPDNEVLEFYGDTLMNYHVTNYFMSKYAHMLDDGLFFMRTVEQFTDMRSHYVCNRYLTDRVKALGLSRYLRAQNRDAELRRDGEKAYADIFESLVGAIYLDSYQNDDLIRAFILRQLGIEPKRQPSDIEAFDYDSLRDPLPPAEPEPEPDEVAALVEPDAPVAPIPVREELPPMEEPPAPEADRQPVETIETPVIEAPVATVQEIIPTPAPNPAAVTPLRDRLAELCAQLGYELPTYGETPPNAPNARPVAACTLKYKDAKGKLVKISLNDSGKTLAEATEKAAAKMLKKLEKQIADTAAKAPAEAPSVQKAAPAVREVPVENLPAEDALPVAEAVTETTVTPEAPVPEVTEPAAEQPAEAEIPTEKAVSEEIPAVTEVIAETASVPVAEASPTAEDLPVAEPIPVEAMPLAEEAQDEPEPKKTVKEKKPPSKKAPAKTKKAVKQEGTAAAEPVAEAAPETSTEAGADPVAEAPAEDEKPTKPKRAPAKKKAAPKEDKPVGEVPVQGVAADTDSAVAPEALPDEAKPVKPKRAPAKKKTAPKAEKADKEPNSEPV